MQEYDDVHARTPNGNMESPTNAQADSKLPMILNLAT
jgi:hypothetical protein